MYIFHKNLKNENLEDPQMYIFHLTEQKVRKPLGEGVNDLFCEITKKSPIIKCEAINMLLILGPMAKNLLT